MKRLALATFAASLFAATSVSAFEELTSPFDANQAETNLAANSLYSFTPSKTGTAFEGEDLGLSFVDQNAAFGPEISLLETGNRENAGFRLGVGYDISGSSAPSIDGRRDTAEARYGNQTSGSRLANDDSDPLSLNLGFRLNF